MLVDHFYQKADLSQVYRKLENLQQFPDIDGVNVEFCYNIETSCELSKKDVQKLKWILCDTVQEKGDQISTTSFFKSISKYQLLIEIGPRLNFSTSFSTNAVSICQAVGISQINRVEKSTRYLIQVKKGTSTHTLPLLQQKVINLLHDRMTECYYSNSINSFDHGIHPESWYMVDVMTKGRKALEEINENLGLSFDDWDLDFYTDLFMKKLKRNPTNVECFDLAQSNSEHSRHWFFKGILNIDGLEIQSSLFEMIMDTQEFSNQNNIIKFSDNSSAINGFTIQKITPLNSDHPSHFQVEQLKQHLIFTAETHNFPTAVSPFSGATTGTGGRIRDVQAVGRGGHTIAGTVGYAVGNLLIPDYELPWEDQNLVYSSTYAKPLEILVEASNGCSDYGNKFGEPVICGYTRSFAMVQEDGRKEYVKPILFSGGMGTVDDRYKFKEKPTKGMKVAKIGGPVYRIGVGGGSASSTKVQGDNKTDLDFGAVQRGDPEMEQKLNRVVRACLEYSDNPILSIHDQGAGGNGNVLKELVEPEGAVIFTKAFDLGDPTISVLELWGAEYQESNGILCDISGISVLQNISRRERCPINFVGNVTGNGRVILTEELDEFSGEQMDTYPVNLDLQLVLGKVPRKKFDLTREHAPLKPLRLPDNFLILEGLNRVLRHLNVCSKRFLTNKVDRSVTGLVAQQQCVGPLQCPVSDVAVTAISYFDKCGVATSVGEQPIKGLLNPAAGARMSVAEALSNLVFAKISSLKDVKCSGNWMWPAKLPGEGAKLYDACAAMCSLMKRIGIAVDGGKDSLSMATRLQTNEIVKSPGTLVISTYVPCPDITKVVTPDLKSSWSGRKGCLLHVDVSEGQNRLGGSVLAQCFNQLGQNVPDIETPEVLASAFNIIQQLIDENKLLSGHDISDGGIATTLTEMAISGMTGLQISLPTESADTAVQLLFSEECGWVLECAQENVDEIIARFNKEKVRCTLLGSTGDRGLSSKVVIQAGAKELLSVSLIELCSIWEETGYRIEKLQTNPNCADKEYASYRDRKGPNYKYELELSPSAVISDNNIKVVVIREEGVNGDREMAAALYMAGFQVWDCTVQDLLDEKISINQFRGVIFPGGFSYADVFGAAKGWAATLLYNEKLYEQFNQFYNRSETFSFGVCNGCQLMSLIKWIGRTGNEDSKTPHIMLKENSSERFESRFSTVKICESPSIMLKNMENSVLGVWVAHHEGRFTYSSPEIEKYLEKNKCVALRYVDDNNEFTESYPHNPNGSSGGVAGICSQDGRHLALMPHPERCIKFWQWPYVPAEWKHSLTTRIENDLFSPWFQIFLNAYNWCSAQ